ncbi:MAG: lysophospholipid acyltransferase family protein [Actinomycetota bacterium]|nr:lysophospholipid acyltransferase family protein [Actinomycetota bacterium]
MRVRRVGAGPLFPDDGPLAARLRRRAKGLTAEVAGFAILTLLFPLVLAGAAIVDLALWVMRRKPWMGVRLVAFAWWFLLAEMRALAALAAIYASTGGPLGSGSKRRRRLIYDLRIHWCRSHLAGIRRLFGVTIEAEGLEHAGPGPVLIFIRHASIVDNTLPDALAGHAHGLGLRFVLKRELEMLPVFDIGARWVPTNFVRRGSGDTAAEVERLRRLAHDMGPDEAILVYPEGTRFTPEKLARAQQVVAERQPHLAPLANRLRHVLPPRLGGPLALLDEARGMDVVFCAHVGLDGFEHIRDIWRGGLVGAKIRAGFWRVPAAEIPGGDDERTAWLYAQWHAVDDWVAAHR